MTSFWVCVCACVCVSASAVSPIFHLSPTTTSGCRGVAQETSPPLISVSSPCTCKQWTPPRPQGGTAVLRAAVSSSAGRIPHPSVRPAVRPSVCPPAADLWPPVQHEHQETEWVFLCVWSCTLSRCVTRSGYPPAPVALCRDSSGKLCIVVLMQISSDVCEKGGFIEERSKGTYLEKLFCCALTLNVINRHFMIWDILTLFLCWSFKALVL